MNDLIHPPHKNLNNPTNPNPTKLHPNNTLYIVYILRSTYLHTLSSPLPSMPTLCGAIAHPCRSYYIRALSPRRPADALQSAVIDMWNNTFGILSGHECKTVVPHGLRRRLSGMAKFMDVKMPFGIALEDESGLELPKLTQFAREQEAVLAAAKKVEHPPHAAMEGTRRAPRYELPGSGNGVAGALPAASARRSFMRQRPR